MNKRIKKLAEQALFDSDFDDEQNIKITLDRFAELIVQDCIQYLTDEINRLNKYRAELEQEPQRNELFIDQVDVCIDKCQDNSQGLKERYGVE